MARALWKGSIAFGLVQIPVGLHGAEEPDELALDLLDRRDFAPVGYERVNKRTGKKVQWDDIVKGYKHRSGDYVVVTDEDFIAANVEATHTIDIDRFVDLSEVDPMYFERPYYVVPDKQGKKAYALLRDTLAKSGKTAVAKVVIRTRQHLAALLPRGDVLVLILLRFAHELRKPTDLDLPEPASKLGITPKERDMAKSLVESMLGEWKPGEYKDEYKDDLMGLIRARAKRGELNQVPKKTTEKPAPAPRAEVIDLVSLLKQSMEQKSGSAKHGSRAKKPRARAAPRARGERALKKSA